MTTPDSAAPDSTVPAPNPTDTADSVFRRILMWMMIAVPLIGIAFAAIGWFAAGQPGLISGLIGAVLALVYSGLTVLSVIVGGKAGPNGFYATILGFWIGKFALFLVALLLLRDQPFIVPWVLILSIIVTALFTLGVDVMIVLRARIPVEVVEPTASTEARRESASPEAE